MQLFSHVLWVELNKKTEIFNYDQETKEILCLSINVSSCHTWKPKLITYLTLSQQDRHNGHPASFNPLQTCFICPLQPNSLNWMVESSTLLPLLLSPVSST